MMISPELGATVLILTVICTGSYGKNVSSQGVTGDGLSGAGNGTKARKDAGKGDKGFPDRTEQSEDPDYYDSMHPNDLREVESNTEIVDSGSISPKETFPTLRTSLFSVETNSTTLTENSSPLPATNRSNSSTITTTSTTTQSENSPMVSATNSSTITTNSSTTPTANSSPAPATNSSTSLTITTTGSKFPTENSSTEPITNRSTSSNSSTTPMGNIPPVKTTNKFASKLPELFNYRDMVDINDYFEKYNAQPNSDKIIPLISTFAVETNSTTPTGNSSPLPVSGTSTGSTKQTNGSTKPTEERFLSTKTISSKFSNRSTTPLENMPLLQTNNKFASKVKNKSYTSSTITTIGSTIPTDNRSSKPRRNSSPPSIITSSSTKLTENISPEPITNSSTFLNSCTTPIRKNGENIPFVQTTNKFASKLPKQFNYEDDVGINDYFEKYNAQPDSDNISSIENYYKDNSDRKSSNWPEHRDKSDFGETYDYATTIDSLEVEGTIEIVNSGSVSPTATISTISTLSGFTHTIEIISSDPAKYNLAQGHRDIINAAFDLRNISNQVNKASNNLDGSTKHLLEEIVNLKLSVNKLKIMVDSMNAVSGRVFGPHERNKRFDQRANNGKQNVTVNSNSLHIHSGDIANKIASDDSSMQYTNESIVVDYSHFRRSDEKRLIHVSNSTSNSGQLKNKTIKGLTNVKSGVEIKNGTGENQQGVASESISDLQEKSILKNVSTTTSSNVTISQLSDSDNTPDEKISSAKTINAVGNNSVVSEKLISSSDLVKFSMLRLNSSINSLIASFEEIFDASNSTLSQVVQRFNISKSRVSSSADKLKLSTNQLTSFMKLLDPLAETLPAVLQLSTASDAVKNATEQLSLSFTSIVAAQVQTLWNLRESFSPEFGRFKNISRDVVNVAVGISSLFQPMLKIVEDFKKISGSENVGSVDSNEDTEISERGKDNLYHPKPRKSDKEERNLKARPSNSDSEESPMLISPKETVVPSRNQTITTWKSKLSDLFNKDVSVKIKAMVGLLGFVFWGAYIFQSVK